MCRTHWGLMYKWSVESLEVSQGNTRTSPCISGLISHEVSSCCTLSLGEYEVEVETKEK